MNRPILLSALLTTACAQAQTVKILFDATKAEMAGNADWVIDADTYNLGVNSAHHIAVGSGNEADPQRVPTPAQSGITTTTAESFWKGALSYWAVDLVRHGYTVETLPYNGAITYGSSTNAQDLGNYKVFVVDEPNVRFTAAEKTALIQFVQNGGGLFMVSDHTSSDRNNDGWDSPAVWNDVMSSNGVQSNPFGITFDLQNFSQTSTNTRNAPADPLLHGVMGNVTGLEFSNGTSMTLNTTANASVLGLVYKTGASNSGTTQALFAAATYGSGKVCALGDSSVPDDGSGDTHDQLYSAYATQANGSHRNLLVNAVIWLATSGNAPITQPRSLASDRSTDALALSLYPNPASDALHIRFSGASSQLLGIRLMDATGKEMMVRSVAAEGGEALLDVSTLPSGIYVMHVSDGAHEAVARFMR